MRLDFFVYLIRPSNITTTLVEGNGFAKGIIPFASYLFAARRSHKTRWGLQFICENIPIIAIYMKACILKLVLGRENH